ncbi:MAG: endonuclease/exonuclease/phosphatase family protein [Rhodobacterales bacterium]|nr:endonuclease/exonuclease/phosphatase family protein [Rhodobacterales bacterium]
MQTLLLSLLFGCSNPNAAATDTPTSTPSITTPATMVRVATFNTALSREDAGALAADVNEPSTAVVSTVSIIQTVRPDILLVQEFDYDPAALDAFADLINTDQGGAALDYPYRLAVVSNTGEASGVDLDNSGDVSGPEDAYGYGNYVGHYAFALLSRYPLSSADVRTFRKLLWSDVPDANLPTNADGANWYSPGALAVLRLSSKSHVIAPINTPDGTLNVLLSHPTPPVFDGDEDRNGRRNHDEIGLLAAILDNAPWLVDDNNTAGGLATDASFVVLGDLNADPVEGDSWDNAIQPILTHARVNADAASGASVPKPEGRPDTHTTSWGLRVDYALPSANLNLLETGLYWPSEGDGRNWVASSDHRMVWVDVTLR